ncbi:hypothetical protein ACVJGC_005468 [Bradyrhizobium diazoefficiens]
MPSILKPVPKKGRGMAQQSLDLIEAMRAIADETAPITGRGIGYKLFSQGLIPSMARSEMARVYRLLRQAREQGAIGWDQIVDETRAVERVATWHDPKEYMESVARDYRRDFWDQQPHRVQVWSEKGTVRGVLQPVLDGYAVGFVAVHGFSSATLTHDVAEDDDGRALHILYAGDLDPSGSYMSECDLPERFARYRGRHIKLKRVALTAKQVNGLPSFPAADKRNDPRYSWFVRNHGRRCWELDAMDPRVLRRTVEREIGKLIEPVAWGRCETVFKAEQESMAEYFANWRSHADD